jgi:hypothetical protein
VGEIADENLPSDGRASGTPAATDAVVVEACERVPGVRNGALVLLAEGVSIGGIGPGSGFDREPLVRAAVRCLGTSNALARRSRKAMEFVEYAFVSAEQITVILRGKLEPRLALVLVCTREPNLALVLTAARGALAEIEATAELVEWVT